MGGLGDVARDEGHVNVPVRPEHLAEVYQFLGRIMRPDQARANSILDPNEMSCPKCRSAAYPAGAPGVYVCTECALPFRLTVDPEEIVVDHHHGCWTEKMILRLAGEVQESQALMLDKIAERSPDAIGSTELADKLSMSPYTLRAELAALSKTCRRLFVRKDLLPMEARQGWGDGSKMGYRMTDQVAGWWREARKATP